MTEVLAPVVKFLLLFRLFIVIVLVRYNVKMVARDVHCSIIVACGVQNESDRAGRAKGRTCAILEDDVKCQKKVTGAKAGGAHPIISHGFVTIGAHERNHAQSMCDELVWEDSGVGFDLDHVDCCTQGHMIHLIQ